jgi:hypothetical protein
MPFDILLPVFLTEDHKLVDEDGELIVDTSKVISEMSFQHPSLGHENKRIGARGQGQWGFSVGDLDNPSSIPANHGFRHFVTLGKTDPEFAKDVAAAGISKKTVKGHTKLHIRTVGQEQHGPLHRVLDKWADHMDAHGGDSVQAAKLRYEAAAVRHSFGSGKPGDAELVAGGRPQARGGGSASSLFGSDDFGIGGAAKAAEPTPAPEAPKKGKTKNPFQKESAPATTANLTESCKAVWRLAESKKAKKDEAPAKVEEAKKDEAPAKVEEAAKKDEAPAK